LTARAEGILPAVFSLPADRPCSEISKNHGTLAWQTGCTDLVHGHRARARPRPSEIRRPQHSKRV
jgi:hypothetical protein